jgi:Zn-finger nucleic acid-binding protein
MTDSWDERRRAQEDTYFDKVNQESLARLSRKQAGAKRKSPVTGLPMEHIVAYGAVIDHCTTSGGVYLDSGELEQILAAAKDSSATLKDFIGALPPRKSSEVVVSEDLPSPDTGKPMKVEKILGISVGRCEQTGGIWLDARELDRLTASAHQSLASSVKDFFALVLGQK